MAYTLSNLLRDAIRLQGSDAFDIRTATGGSTTTVIDTSLEDKYGDNELKNGFIIVIRDTSGVAPEGEFSTISSYVESTNTITVGTLSSGVGAGDKVMIVPPDYPLNTLIELANDALRDCGKVSAIDETLTTVADATEYSLPAACKDLRNVYIQQDTDTNDNNWDLITGWRVEPTAGNVAGTLIFQESFVAGYTIQLQYNTTHPQLSTYSGAVNEAIDPQLAALRLAEKIIGWYGVTDANRDAANKILVDLESAKRTYPVRRTKRVTRFLEWGDS